MKEFALVVGIILLLLPIIDWTAFAILGRASQGANSIALNERSRVALILAIITTLNAVIAANADFSLNLDPNILTVILAVSLLLVGLPNLFWLILYFSHKFRSSVDVESHQESS